MPNIQRLSPRLANQIAAGEVVERPASVVKEVLENSLDAGATRVDIDAEEGGVKRLCVRDNGGGMAKEDLPLALCRHATSKIKVLDDLEAVATLGFRGEALASISSVSRLVLTSNSSDDSHSGWKAKAEGRDMAAELAPAPHPQGTTVEIRDLFFNTPARRKFLRTEKTEFNRIDDVVKQLALAHFQVAFELRHNQRVVHSFRAGTSEAEKIVEWPKFVARHLWSMPCPSISNAMACACGAGWRCRPFPAVRPICSTFTSMAGRLKTA